MPEDPNNRMDEMLKAYAEQGRKKPDIQIHPATRRMLQDEVARVYPPSQKRSGVLEMLRRFWPQLAIGGALALIGLVAALNVARKDPEMVLASRDEAANSAPAPTITTISESDAGLKKEKSIDEVRQLADAAESKDRELGERNLPAPAPTSPPQERLPQLARARNERSDQKSADDQAKQLAAAASAPEQSQRQRRVQEDSRSAEARADFFKLDGTNLANRRDQPEAELLQTAASPVTTAATAKPRPTDLTNLGAALRMNFTQLPTTAQTANPATLPILSAFSVEQLGENLKFVDNDGSVYFGKLVLREADAVAPPQQVLLQDTAGSRVLQLPGRNLFTNRVDQSTVLSNSLAYDFQVEGTNRTLSNNVVVQGTYFQRTNPPQGIAGVAAQTETQTRAAGRVPAARFGLLQQAAPPKAAIVGIATIGNTNELQINAVAPE
jgi:hypothetical protein